MFSPLSNGRFEKRSPTGIIRNFAVGARKNRVLFVTTTPGLEWKSRWRLSECLERELPRKLKDSWIKRGVDLAKVGVVDVQ